MTAFLILSLIINPVKSYLSTGIFSLCNNIVVGTAFCTEVNVLAVVICEFFAMTFKFFYIDINVGLNDGNPAFPQFQGNQPFYSTPQSIIIEFFFCGLYVIYDE